MIWGETGTRNGVTHRQLASAAWLFAKYGIERLHDGDCVGADEQLFYLAKALDIEVTLHPPTNEKFRAFCGQWDLKTTILGEAAYFVRDAAIVDDAQLMVGFPKQNFEPKESWKRGNGGTWWTINYSRKRGKPLATVWPNGLITYERWENVVAL
jgi:hypothetical protein